ncbi:thioredoxin, mitochondrial-like [Centruroides vittatus]|uniref:thioredoxin, mitochondrial-like n=1 Tax=Centruroides vittatus TaxID=120091 RepID=UPI003510ADE8
MQVNRNFYPIVCRLLTSNSLVKIRQNVLPSRNFVLSATLKDCFTVQDENDFKEKVLKSEIPVIVDFQATWCGPCKTLGPRLEGIIATKNDKVHLAKVDIDDNSDLAIEYGVSAVPSVFGIKNGKVIDKFVGVLEDDKINSFVDKLIGPV